MRRVPFVPTRIQKSIYIYDVSGLDDTATGYAGLEASRGGGEGTKRWRSKKEERKRGREKRWEKYVHAPLFRGRHSGKQTSSACFEQRRVNGEVEKNEDEDGFHNGRFPIFLISNLFKFPATVTSERFVRGEESCTE